MVQRGNTPRAHGCSRSRAQLVLVSALVLAAIMIGLALVLNATIVTQHYATQSRVDTGNAVALQGAANTSAKAGIREINAHNEVNRSHPQLLSDYTSMIEDWDGRVGRRVAGSGRAISLTREEAHFGTRILQTNPDRNFTAGGTSGMATDETWSVAEDVSEVGVFEQNLSRGSMFTATYGTTQAALADSSYHVAIDEPGVSGVWRVYIFEGAGTQNVYVLVEEPDQDFHGNTEAHVNWATEACAHQTLDYVEVDIRSGTVGGAPCDDLGFFTELTPGYDIYYNKTAETVSTGTGSKQVNRTKGTYELFVNESAVDTAPYYQASADESPFTLTALFSVDLALDYTTSRVDRETAFEAQPERGSGPTNRRPGASATVTDDGADPTDVTVSGSYQVDWSVDDPDGDLDSVEVLLYDNATETEVDSATVDVGGLDADGTTTLEPTTGGVRYDIYVLATDEAGATTVRKWVDIADDSDP